MLDRLTKGTAGGLVNWFIFFH